MLDVEPIIQPSCSFCQKPWAHVLRFLFSVSSQGLHGQKSGVARLTLCRSHVMSYLPDRVSECLNCNQRAFLFEMILSFSQVASNQLGSLRVNDSARAQRTFISVARAVLLVLGQCHPTMGYCDCDDPEITPTACRIVPFIAFTIPAHAYMIMDL